MLFRIGSIEQTTFLDMFVEKSEPARKSTTQCPHITSFRNLGDKKGVSTTVVLAVKCTIREEELLGIGVMKLDKHSQLTNNDAIISMALVRVPEGYIVKEA